MKFHPRIDMQHGEHKHEGNTHEHHEGNNISKEENNTTITVTTTQSTLVD